MRIGEFSSIGDSTVISTFTSLSIGVPSSVNIGKNVTVGSHCYLCSCTIDDECVISSGCQIMEGARLERGCMLAPNSVVSPGRLIPAGQLWGGSPATFIRELDPEQRLRNYKKSYASVEFAGAHAAQIAQPIMEDEVANLSTVVSKPKRLALDLAPHYGASLPDEVRKALPTGQVADDKKLIAPKI